MKIAFQNDNVQLWHGDCREWSGKADAVLTVPPYGIEGVLPQADGHKVSGLPAYPNC